jgi:two-component system, cell cycle sensor histidine kinase and response regulator CckA
MTAYLGLEQRLRRARWTVTLSYASFAALWILFSDALLGLMVRDAETLVRISLYKGLAFVGVTAALLAVLLHRVLGHVGERETTDRQQRDTLVAEQKRILEEKSAQLEAANQRLSSSAWELQMAGRLARLGGWWVDLASSRVVWSDEVCRIHGEPEGTSPLVETGINYYAEASRPVIAAAFHRCVETGAPYDLELEIVARDGRLVKVRAIGEAVRDEAGRIVRVQGAFQDVTEARREQQERKDLAERLRSTMENISDAVIMYDRELRILYLNREGERITQRKFEDIAGLTLFAAFPGTEGSRFDTEYKRAFAEMRTARFEEYYAPLDRWFEVTGHPSADGLVAYFRDVTERRARDQKLAMQAALLDKAQDAILVRALDDNITYWNKGAERLYGWTAEEAVGRNAPALLKDSSDDFMGARAELLARGEWIGTLRQVTRDGRRVLTECRWTLVRDDTGEPESVLSINTDVTDRRSLEQQFLRAQRLESIGTLAGGIAHDLNNVLSPVMMSLDLLSDMVGSNGAELVHGLRRSVGRGADLVRQVLTFARGHDGRKERVDFKLVIRETEAVIRDTFPKNISLVVELAPNLCCAMGDVTQMHQVLMNLAVNARDAMPDGGTLTLRLCPTELSAEQALHVGVRPGQYVRLEVTDDGEGIAPEHQEFIFEPFFTTKEVGRGTGLGLSTVMSIVHGHGGAITLDSTLGAGSTFTCWFPQAADAEEPPSAPSLARRLPRGEGECILVVDDEPAIRNVSERLLSRHGYRVFTAADGREGLALYRAHRVEIDAVITDVSMPVMDGPELIAALRAEGADIPIIVSSGYVEGAGAGRLLDSDTEFFISKPFTAEVLLTTLRGVLVAHA